MFGVQGIGPGIADLKVLCHGAAWALEIQL